MRSFKNILYATDFSAPAQAALPIACALARDYGACLTLVHVRAAPEVIAGEFGVLPSEPGESDESVRARLGRLVPADFKSAVNCVVRDGDAAHEILAEAERQHADVIVLGTHGRSGLRRLLLGSVAEMVLREASCPVLTIRAPAPATTKTSPQEAEPVMDRDQLATVCSLANPAEAEVIRLRLKEEGIRAFMEGAQQAGVVA